MDNFKGNPKIEKKTPEREKLEAITKNVSLKKESEFKKFKKNFFAEDAKTVKGQVFSSVIIPGLQRLVKDMINTAVDVLLYGGRVKDPRDSRTGYVSYSSSFSDRNREYNKVPQSAYNKNFFSFNEVVFFDRGETEEVLISLREQISRYGMVSIADFYDMVGQSAPHTANKHGWRDLTNADIERVRDGYSIIFPKTTPLD